MLVDNGRSRFRENPTYRPSLHCIRCGACLNTCPVFRRSGGHSYHAAIPGPIGSVLGPLRDAKQHYSLPYACSLCGSCSDVCPVKIPLHEMLLAWRGDIAERKLLPWTKRFTMKMARIVLGKHVALHAGRQNGPPGDALAPALDDLSRSERLGQTSRDSRIPAAQLSANSTGKPVRTMTGNSKQTILDSLRRTRVEAVPLPNLDGPWTVYENPRQQFIDVLSAVGGQAFVVRGLEEVNSQLLQIPAFRDARKVCSRVAGIANANVDLDAPEDPHELEDVDFFVAPGEFAVAENAAVWVTDDSTKHRVLYFLAQHMALVVPADQMVSNLYEAYGRLKFDRPQFGLFLSGPSKTADIEQSLVIA